MGESVAERIELGMDAVAAALLGAATAVVLLWLDSSNGYAATGAAVAFVGGIYALRSIGRENPTFTLAPFALTAVEAEELEELVLTEPATAGAELVLDDILAEIGPDSRVVRLFDPSAMPKPSQLKAGIGQSQDRENPQAALRDASQALYDALHELRRSLR